MSPSAVDAEIAALKEQVFAQHDQVAELRAAIEDVYDFLSDLFPSREIKAQTRG